MRDYRGKRIDNGEFVYGSLQKIQKYKDLPPKCYILQPDGFKLMTSQQLHWPEEKRWKQDYIQHEVDPKTVGQYTGLPDRYGKEICESDDITYNGRMYRVIWDHGRFLAATCDDDVFIDLCEINKECEIFENPNLLGG